MVMSLPISVPNVQPEPEKKPAEKSAEKPQGKPAEKPPGQPAEKSAGQPAQKPAKKPADTPAQKPAVVPAQKPAEQPAKLEGLWPSPTQMDQFLRRWAQDIGHRHELNETQKVKVEEAVVKRWSTFLDNNRGQIQPLVNEFIELRMGVEPPSKQRVQDWAKRATPVFEQFRGQLEQGKAEVREILDPLQRAKFDVEAMAYGAMMTSTEQRLKKWESGEFDAREFWQPTPSQRREMRQERDRQRVDRKAGAAGAKPDQRERDHIELELEVWDQYVEQFIRLYDLDEAQRTTALSCLSELKQRALAHRDHRKEDIAKLEKRIKEHKGSEEDLAEIKKQLAELYGPIDDMFGELKRRLESIPTAEQRAKVTEGKPGS
jgi:hypothetical protein